MRWKLVLPWRYLAMLAAGLIVLGFLVARYGRTAPVLFGWLAGWLALSRGVDFLLGRRRRRRRRSENEPS
jgi:hypothetical protein